MARGGGKILLCLSLLYSVCNADSELSPESIFDTLSRRIDYIIVEISNLKSGLTETKSDIQATILRVEKVENKISTMKLYTDSRKADMSESDMNNRKKEQSVAIRKMLATEKSILRKMADKFENKFTAFETDIISQLSLLNVSMESSVDSLFRALKELKLETNTSLALTDKQIADVKKDIEDKSEHSRDKINEVSQDILSRTRSELESTKDELAHWLNLKNSAVLSKLVSVERTQESLESNFNRQIKQLSSRMQEKEGKAVAFSTRLGTERSHYGKKERIVFDQVDYSHGGGYNPSTGIFTAPKSGTYLFTFNIEATNSGLAHVVLKIRSYTKTRVIATKGTDSNAGNAAVNYLLEGNKVWIETSEFRDKYYIWPHRTTFNGVLID